MHQSIKTLLATAVIAAAVVPAAQALEGGDMIVRFGSATVSTNVSSSRVTVDNGAVADGVKVGNDTQFGLSGTYMMSPTVGFELLAATPFKHDITLSDGTPVGTTKQLPPTLSVQYYPMGASQSKWQPYVGLGINYTTFFGEEVDDSKPAGTTMELDDSFGLAAQAGVDYYITDHWLVNASAMYADIGTSATIDTGEAIVKVDADLDPWVYRLNVGYKF